MCLLNGRTHFNNQGNYNHFTSISPKGPAVVDYCLLPSECVDRYKNFSVITMTELLALLSHLYTLQKLSDHSILTWDLVVNDENSAIQLCPNSLPHTPLICKPSIPSPPSPIADTPTDSHSLNQILTLIESLQDPSIVTHPSLYIEANYSTFLCTIIPPAPRTTSVLYKSSSSYIRSSKKPWWSSSLTAARKTLKSTQRRWLKNKSDQNLFINYKVAQRHFDKLVRNSKRSLIRKKRENLLGMLSKNQRKFWKTFDRISVASERAQKEAYLDKLDCIMVILVMILGLSKILGCPSSKVFMQEQLTVTQQVTLWYPK